MSRLTIKTNYAGQFTMNVLRFSAPMFGTMLSGQTKTKMAYFPIKAQHPELELEVIFASVADYNGFQSFVRASQLNGLMNTIEPGVTLWWPQRNISNWTGVIKSFRGGGERFVYAPRAKFSIDLIDSFVSTRTTVASVAPLFSTIYGVGSPDGVMAQSSPPAPGSSGAAPVVVPGSGTSGPVTA